ncbi:hypothetical protein H5410_062471 [Solanum commersonii]|uniref:Uncharacterized protein n=1 Tax=Solanum commersonii TaxID=4109 RepID=A0A9J5WAR5_SOLCO|nr:hypothetical protein H5410_062471 [Solanum commersonii]
MSPQLEPLKPAGPHLPSFQKESTSLDSVAKKPLGVFFQEVVGLLKKSEQSESEENKELNYKLRKLEEERKNERDYKEEARNVNGVLENEGKSNKLHELLMNKEVKSVKSRKSTSLSMEDHTVYKELSPDMGDVCDSFMQCRYFKDSNFFPRRKFDITCFENSYARDFVKYAAEQFGRDHQEIAK